jgi:hypothetical protein
LKALIIKLSKMFPQSLLADFERIFGTEATEKLLIIFAGTTLQVPSTKELDEAQRDIVIYKTLSGSKSISESRRLGVLLCQQYNISRREMRRIYKKTRRKLKEAKRFNDSDQRVGNHLPKRIKVKRVSKRRM